MSISAEDTKQTRWIPNGDDGEIARHLVSQSGAICAIVWDCQQQPFQIVGEHYSRKDFSLWCTPSQHQQLLEQVCENGRGAVVTGEAEAGSGTDTDQKPPILIAPVSGQSSKEQPSRLVELIFADIEKVPDPEQTLTHLIEFCETMIQMDLSGEVPTNQTDIQTEQDPALSIPRFAQFSLAIHASIDREDTCLSVANESRLLVDCDRVSVILRNRGRLQLSAISGQPSVNRRSSTVKTLETLGNTVLSTGDPFWFPNQQTLAPQVQEALDEYLEISSTRSIAILPVHDFEAETIEDPDGSTHKHPRVLGGLIFEHSRQQWQDPGKLASLQMVSQHCASAIRNAQQHQGLFLYPLWKLLGNSRILAAPRVLPKVAVAAAVLFLAAMILLFWQTPFYVASEGELLPTTRQLVFPQTQGEVVQVAVAHGDIVAKGQTLVSLQSDDLDLKLEDVNGKIQTLEERKSSIQRSKFGNARKSSRGDESNLRALQAEIDSLRRQLTEYERIKNNLDVKSPLDGQVITWDVQQNLKGRVVSPQNQLMEIADTDGLWQLSLEISDQHADDVLIAWKKNQSSGSNDAMKVRFSLASDPGASFEGHVVDVGNEIQLNEDHHQVLRVKVNLDSLDITVKKARTGVTAKIYTGESTSLGALWLCNAADAFRRHVLFYLVQ